MFLSSWLLGAGFSFRVTFGMDRAKRGEEQGEAELLSERSTWTKDWQDGDICPTQSQTLTKDKLPSEDTESYRFLPLLKVTATPLIGSFSLNSFFCHSFTFFSAFPLFPPLLYLLMHHLFACCVLLYCGVFSVIFWYLMLQKTEWFAINAGLLSRGAASKASG